MGSGKLWAFGVALYRKAPDSIEWWQATAPVRIAKDHKIDTIELMSAALVQIGDVGNEVTASRHLRRPIKVKRVPGPQLTPH